MDEKAQLEKVSQETMRFMRGKYVLDEVPGKYYQTDCLKFRQGKKTILSINIHEDHYDFQVILGKAEREKFEARSNGFSSKIQALYDSQPSLHDGKWLLIRVENLADLEEIKKLILIKKKPNRKPFSKEQAVYAACGHRCDLCIHYTGGTISDAFRKELKQRLTRVYDDAYWGEDMAFCSGCESGGINGKHDCHQKTCAAAKAIDQCANCGQYPCSKATAGYPPRIEMKHILAHDVTWAILPYVDGQYGN